MRKLHTPGSFFMLQQKQQHRLFKKNNTSLILFLMAIVCGFLSCKKIVSISDPVDQVSSGTVFSSDDLAKSAMNGVYYNMWYGGFMKRRITFNASLSSDELTIVNPIAFSDEFYLSANRLLITGVDASAKAPTDIIWNACYGVIYTANAVIEGIAASGSANLHEPVRVSLTAEAKCIRALCYFYLVNFYGDLPLVLTTEFSDVALIVKRPKAKIYEQIIDDLKEAQAGLPVDFAAGGGERIRANKWAATALLAKAYLYTGDYAKAVEQADIVINNTGLFALESNLNNVFLKNSRETIWQFKQNTDDLVIRNATDDGIVLLPTSLTGPAINYALSKDLLRSFDLIDKRRDVWIDSVVVTRGAGPTATRDTFFYASKYKVGTYNSVRNAVASEYCMIMRLAEVYLVRAEAKAMGAPGGSAGAVADLNIIRARAGLPMLPALSGTALQDAISREWQTEFFCERGQRWFNLKRTGKATEVLSAIAYKQPWAGDYQLLYPIPPKDVLSNPQLVQNPGY